MSLYSLFGQGINFTDAQERFFTLYHSAEVAAQNGMDDFSKWYSECGNIVAVLKGAEQKMANLVVKYANSPLYNQLTTLELYDITEKEYDEECLIMDNFIQRYNEVCDRYNDILAEQEAAEEYRAERKASRGRVVGGGFGVSGALKGMAAAGAMNAVSGMAHGLVNAAGNAVSSLEASSAKKALYYSDDTKTTLCRAVWLDIFGCYMLHAFFVNDRKPKYYDNSYDLPRADVLFKNAKELESKRIDLLLASFKLNPSNRELLEFIFKNYKEERKNIWDIAKRFYLNLGDTAEDCFASAYATCETTSEESVQQVRKEILDQMQLLGIPSSETVDKIETDGVRRLLDEYETANLEHLKMIFSELEKYDASDKNKAAIVREKGIWEIAKKYSVTFSSEEVECILGRFYSSSTHKTGDRAQQAKAKIKVIMNELGVMESRTFDTLETDCLQRLCPQYSQADEALCNEIRNRIKAYDALEKNKKPFFDGIQARIEEIWSKEDGEIFDNLFLKTNIWDSNSVEDSINYINSKARTSSSQKYLSALELCTSDGITKASFYKKPIWVLCKLLAALCIAFGIVLYFFLDLGFVPRLLIVAVPIGIGIFVWRKLNGNKDAWNTITLEGTIIHPMLCLDNSKSFTNPIDNANETTQEKETNQIK